MGALILNRFTLRERLGSGGFGTVYRAWDEKLERDVAVKVIEAGGRAGRRVLREAQAAARLNHPGIVTLYELGSDDGHAYLVSELVEGATLADLSRRGALSDRDIGEAAAELCDALGHSHSRGVVHRDIKPQNVLLSAEEPQAKLMDFGIARVVDAVGITATGNVVGTLAYMAPEQADGDPAGPAADTYSLALTLYEAWSGENPHARATPAATARAIGTPLPPLDDARPDLPAAICETIDACLEPDPELRAPLEELGEAIEESMEGLDSSRAAPRARRGSLIGRIAERLDPRQPAELAAAASVAGLSSAAMIAAPASGLAWAYLLPPLAALLTLLRPRLGFLAAAVGLTAWLAGPAGRPGVAAVLAAIAIPPALLIGGGGRSLTLPAAAPALGAVGLAPLFPVLAGLARRPRERLLLGASGYAWLAVAEVALDRKLLFGPAIVAPSGWERSAQAAVTDVLLPLATDPGFLFGVAIWSLAALTLGMLVRGRSPALDLLGALVWAAGLVAAHRLRAGAVAPSPSVLAAGVLLVVAAALVWRARGSGQRHSRSLGAVRGPLQRAGHEATLS